MRAIDWDAGTIRIIDQTLLPAEETVLTLTSTAALGDAIRRLKIRGAPALGIAGAMGVAQAAYRSQGTTSQAVLRDAERAGRELAATRPTAVNLAWAIDRMLKLTRERAKDVDKDKLVVLLEEEAQRIAQEDANACIAMARNAQRYIPPKAVVLTHCNTGFLCTGGYGTALGAIRLAHEEKKEIAVLATETRPLLQGSRLTTWELGRLGIPHALIADGAAAGLIARGEVKVVMVGADRVAANGDVANKVGTFALALAAKDAGIPFVVVAPTTTIDVSMASGSKIPIEERAASEVTGVLGRQVAPAGTYAVNPAFDITPVRLITAIVTENGVATAPFATSIQRLVKNAVPPARPSKKPPAAQPAARKKPAARPAAKKTAPRSAAKKVAAKKAPAKRAPARKSTARPAAKRARKR
ncbi:MAG: S-methyl-5-thioribose-1-phosphate isomerase [Actinobacteria bacterium]|nr:MAG: S-methyl-5-thioribose-1-phosphate isomerase [Actinomycetota bacterium]